MLRSLSLDGFKAFGKGEVQLRPFTVLIGPNGSGKTTIMEAIDILGRLVTGSIKDLLEIKGWEYGDLPHLRGATSEFSITADLDLAGASMQWTVALGTRRRPGISGELVQVMLPGSRGTGETPVTILERRGRAMWRMDADGQSDTITQTLTSSWLSAIGDEDNDRFPQLVQIAAWARGIRGYFFLDPLRLRSPSRGDGHELGVNGEYLAPFLARLRDRNRAAFLRVENRVRKHYPRLVELHAARKGNGLAHLEITERWNGETARFNARQVSDGLLRLIAVAAMHELPITPSVLLLDEVENGLHPHLLGGFVRMLQDLVKSSAGTTQVILTTHSPITVNFCESADDVIVVMRGRGGHPQCRPLSKTRGFDKLRAHFELGELWYNVGERDLVR
jgi:predicted ATPase